MSGYEAARANMIERQLQPNKVTDERVLNAFASVRRELFVPERLRAIAYSDSDLPLGNGRYLMAPMVAARLLQAAEAGRGDSALVIGAGVGYEAALLAQLVRQVVAVEQDAELARQGRTALVEHRIASVNFAEEARPRAGRSRSAYEIVFVAGAVAEVTPEIAAQLAEGGRLVAVTRPDPGMGRAILMTRTGGVLATRVMFDAATPLLPGSARKPAFVF
ncbi:MAG: protein-L-isoaspartate O-methyltransferase [Alphaproteobacteria bacterium]|nr:protein-L-isoaspartate O-methyltransferase [Alphaproteobacteria bacterium]